MCSMKRMQAQRREWFSRWSSNGSTSCQNTGCVATIHGSNLSLEVPLTTGGATHEEGFVFGWLMRYLWLWIWWTCGHSGLSASLKPAQLVFVWWRCTERSEKVVNAAKKPSLFLPAKFYNKCTRFVFTTHFGFGCKWEKKKKLKKIYLNLSFNKISCIFSWEKRICTQHDEGKGACWWEFPSSGPDAPSSPFQHPPPVTLGPYSAFAGRILKEMAHFLVFSTGTT